MLPQVEVYYDRRWARARRLQLQRFPLCKFCLEEGLLTAAAVVDHVVPHRGDHDLFRFGELQSLCKRCHDSHKKRQESRGFASTVGLDGLPRDPTHPFWTGGPSYHGSDLHPPASRRCVRQRQR